MSIKGIKEPDLKNISLYRLKYGIQLTPERIIHGMDEDQYEEFVACWLIDCISPDYCKIERDDDGYSSIKKTGGAGDKGRDVIAYIDNDKSIWDNYQCKHYQNKLTPTDIYVEVGKLIYYTYIGDFSIPRKYYFVAPRGVGTKLSDLLQQSNNFKEQVFLNWEKYCKEDITKKKHIELKDEFLAYFTSFDFKIFTGIDTYDMIKQFESSRFYTAFFGGGFSKPRPLDKKPPSEINASETNYIGALLEAYSDYYTENILTVEQLKKYKKEYENFSRQRINFYKSESLKQYVEEALPTNSIFMEYQNDIYEALVDTIEDDYDNGYSRLKETLKEVPKIVINSSFVEEVVKPADKKGICHQLTNENRFRWVEKNE